MITMVSSPKQHLPKHMQHSVAPDRPDLHDAVWHQALKKLKVKVVNKLTLDAIFSETSNQSAGSLVIASS